MRSTIGHSSAFAIRTGIVAATLAHASIVKATATGTVSAVPARTEGAAAG